VPASVPIIEPEIQMLATSVKAPTALNSYLPSGTKFVNRVEAKQLPFATLEKKRQSNGSLSSSSALSHGL
jgi:hypothetical protein